MGLLTTESNQIEQLWRPEDHYLMALSIKYWRCKAPSEYRHEMRLKRYKACRVRLRLAHQRDEVIEWIKSADVTVCDLFGGGSNKLWKNDKHTLVFFVKSGKMTREMARRAFCKRVPVMLGSKMSMRLDARGTFYRFAWAPPAGHK